MMMRMVLRYGKSMTLVNEFLICGLPPKAGTSRLDAFGEGRLFQEKLWLAGRRQRELDRFQSMMMMIRDRMLGRGP
jgi:hypothetical protein